MISFSYQKFLYLSINNCMFSAGTCCSADGWCSFDPEDCFCDECIYYEYEKGTLTALTIQFRKLNPMGRYSILLGLQWDIDFKIDLYEKV